MKKVFDKSKVVFDNGLIQLTEEDIRHLKKSEEDIENGRVHTLEEVKQIFKERGLKYEFIKTNRYK